MSQTIQVGFDPELLPLWAQRERRVVERCEVDPSFRRDVLNAKGILQKLFLVENAVDWHWRRIDEQEAT